MTRNDRKRRLQLRFYERLTLFRAVGVVVHLALALTLGAALLVRLLEPETFTSFGDACWWAIATVSSTGYGDLAPQTAAGRIVGASAMVMALALVPAVTAIVTALLVHKREAELRASRPNELQELAQKLDRLESGLATLAIAPMRANGDDPRLAA